MIEVANKMTRKERRMISEEKQFIEEYAEKMPLPVMAEKLNKKPYEIATMLRKWGRLGIATAYDIQYIFDNYHKKQVKEMEQELHLTHTQIDQILKRLKIGKRVKATEEYTEEEVIQRMRYIVEEKLKWQIDDSLPNKLVIQEMMAQDGYAIVKYATDHKKNHPVYKYFSAIAYLCHLAYPNAFRPYQFAHMDKTKEYITKNYYLEELSYIIEYKLGYKLDYLPQLINLQTFLNRVELDYYGLGAHTYRRLFNNKKEMLEALLNHHYMQEKVQYAKTPILKERLVEVGIDPYKCFCPGCQSQEIQIHHIHAKRYSARADFDLDEVFNLMPLCYDHHQIVNGMSPDSLSDNRENWREEVINFINSKKRA